MKYELSKPIVKKEKTLFKVGTIWESVKEKRCILERHKKFFLCRVWKKNQEAITKEIKRGTFSAWYRNSNAKLIKS